VLPDNVCLGLSYTTPVNASVIQLINPILVVVFAAILIKEKLQDLNIRYYSWNSRNNNADFI